MYAEGINIDDTISYKTLPVQIALATTRSLSVYYKEGQSYSISYFCIHAFI